MSPRVTKRSCVEKYFDFIGDQAKCKLCLHKLKSNRIFNLKMHVMKVHKLRDSELRAPDIKINTVVSTTSGRRKHMTKVEISKHQLIRSYIGLVVEDGIPLNILDSGNFKNILEPICRGLSAKLGKRINLNSNNLLEILKLISSKIRNEIKFELNQRRLLSIKVDSVTDLPNSLCISAQFIEKSEIQCRILGIVEVNGAGESPSNNLARVILDTLTKYDIELSQIVSITWDNTINMMKAEFLKDDYERHDLEDDNATYLRSLHLFEESLQISLGDIEITRYAACTVQLCALDILKDTEMMNYVLSCRNLVIFLKTPSNGYLEVFERHGLTVPQLDCPKRWGSTYAMMNSLKNAKEFLGKIEPIENKEIDENFWNFTKAYCTVFEPVQLTIAKMQEEQLHYGNFYAEWLKCKLCTEKIYEHCANAYVKEISKLLLHSMENRTQQLLNDLGLISCLYMDPRFNRTLSLAKKLEATIYLKQLYDRIKNTNITEKQIKTESSSSSNVESIKFTEKADEYLNEYLTRNFVPKVNESGNISAKIEGLQMPFLRVDSSVLEFWRDKQSSDPELYALSNICFAMPSNKYQASIEHGFASLRLIFAHNAYGNNKDILEDILLIKQNVTYLDQTIQSLPLFEDDK